MKIKIDPRKSVPENASFYYERSKKLKQKLKGAKEAVKKTREEIEKLNVEQGKFLEKVPEPEKKSKRMWYEKFRHFHSGEFLILGGKDATTNDILIKKYLEPKDLVFHADIEGAPFFVIKNPENKEIPGEIKKGVAELAASYSKAWKLGLGSCNVYCIKPEQISKEAPAGEYLSKGAFMIRGKKEWFRNTRLEIAVGLSDKVIAGPPSIVEKLCKSWVRIIPGDTKSLELSREIKKSAMKTAGKEAGGKIKKIPLEEIQRLIPGGEGRILK